MTDVSDRERPTCTTRRRRTTAAPARVLPVAALLLMLAAAVAARPAAAAAPQRDPLIAAAGDVACNPADPNFNGGEGTERNCAQKRTSDLLLTLDPDAVLTIGDAQYNNGLLPDFEASYDPSWGRVKDITRPVIGNHEYFGEGTGYFDYFNGPGVFTGPAGDRDKGYYSYDLGSWHLIALNSVCSRIGGCGPASPQARWLEADLAAHPNACTLAYWHHPVFTSSSGGWSSFRPVYRVLYEAGVELALTGHAHEYERFAPQDYNGDGDPGFGVREFVVGTGGKSLNPGPLTPAPNAEVVDASTFGVLALTLHDGAYSWRFVGTPGGTLTDSGTATCHGTPPPRPPTASTGPVTGSSKPSGRLNAEVDPKNQPTTYRFEYGPTAAYGQSTPETPIGWTAGARQQVFARVDGLTKGRTYHYRVVATNATGTAVGPDRTFVAGRRTGYQRTIQLTRGLLAYWRLSDAADGFAFDQRGLNLGIQDGAAPQLRRGAVAGDPDPASSFNGSMSIQARGPALSTSGTIEGWFRWTDGGTLMRDDSATRGWYLAGISGGRLAYRVSGRTYRTRRPLDSVRDGAWHYVALTKSGDRVALFVDGRRVHRAGGAPSVPATMPWHFMRNGPFEGKVTGEADEIAMYDRALPADTIAAHYRAGVRDRAPVTTIEAPAATNKPVPPLRFTANRRGTSFRCAFAASGQTATFAPCRSPLRPAPLADGSYRLVVYGIRDGYTDSRLAARTFTVDTVVPTLTVSAPSASLRKGVRTTAVCSERCTIEARLTVRGKAAKRLKSRRGRPVVIGRLLRASAAARPAKLVVRVDRRTRRALRQVRPLHAALRITATDAAGNARVDRRVLTLAP